MVHRLRSAGEEEIGELAAAVGEAVYVAPGGAVIEGKLHLLDLETRTNGVDRHPRLHAEPRREREHGGACPLAQAALARERLTRNEAAAELDQRPRGPLREPEAAPATRCEGSDRQLCLAVCERAQVTPNVCVTEEKWPRPELAFGQRQRLPLAAALEPDHPRSGAFGDSGCRVARAVVGDHDLGVRELLPQSIDRRPDSALLVAGSDEDGHRTHPRS